MMNTDTIQQRARIFEEVVDLIFSSLNLRYVDRASLSEKTALIGDGLGLDSVDILEIIVALEQKYRLRITNAEEGKKIFQNIGSVCDYVLLHGHHVNSAAASCSDVPVSIV